MKDANEDLSFLVAPTERNALLTLIDKYGGAVSMKPETLGSDVAWRAHGAYWAVQRKELKDFLTSVQDGRLARELAQMQALPFPVLLIEGKVRFDDEARLMWNARGQVVTRAQFRGMLWSVRSMGVHVDYTADTQDTTDYVEMLARWSVKEKHQSLLRRPGPVNMWGKAGNADFAHHLLQGFDGVGLDKARAIVERFGRVPLQWTVTEKELTSVPGVGKVIARRLVEALAKDEDADGGL